jgi:hypothetical protein
MAANRQGGRDELTRPGRGWRDEKMGLTHLSVNTDSAATVVPTLERLKQRGSGPLIRPSGTFSPKGEGNESVSLAPWGEGWGEGACFRASYDGGFPSTIRQGAQFASSRCPSPGDLRRGHRKPRIAARVGTFWHSAWHGFGGAHHRSPRLETSSAASRNGSVRSPVGWATRWRPVRTRPVRWVSRRLARPGLLLLRYRDDPTDRNGLRMDHRPPLGAAHNPPII